MKEISVILPTYNKAFYLNLVLVGYCLQSYTDFEIIIIDDGSTDDTKEVIAKYENKLIIKYFYQDNAGRAKAKNRAIEMVTSRYVIFADDDRIPSPYFVEEHLKKLKENKNYVTIGKKCKILSRWSDEMRIKKETIRMICKRNISDICHILENDLLITEEGLLKDFDREIEKFYLGECTDNYSMVWSEFGKELKGFYFGWVIATTGNMGVDLAKNKIYFDENICGWGGEDNEYAYRLYKEGGKFVLAEKAVNYHQYHIRNIGEMDQLKRNLKYLVEKYPVIEMKLFQKMYERQSDTYTLLNLNKKYVEMEVESYILDSDLSEGEQK